MIKMSYRKITSSKNTKNTRTSKIQNIYGLEWRIGGTNLLILLDARYHFNSLAWVCFTLLIELNILFIHLKIIIEMIPSHHFCAGCNDKPNLMAKLFAVGSPLLDIITPVSIEFLQQLNLKCGTFSLVSETTTHV
jgi:hypothetical protein